ncbi:phenylalanine--tRNA ligase subunit beta [Glaciecola sp. XM2]|uniref:phenylalanine--tRNA ligase subunit beta n=1 Tax=Glaciecola sp. XM2 TaxID=1914931 RepID=UPI001BDE5457|nr:phenylalanine--tRNA ligase subunit beta [Glaciecola sp. XM2]MBT1449749.1 phenylalanine--tRNA ligase subunit beta [Glaciecola sp. XM2]
MKFSESWLREWVNPALDTNALCEQLSMAGLEVDGVEPVAGAFSGVVVGEVVTCTQHPDADKLQVTKVNVGEDELLDIVCGAPNCRQGLKVAVAKVGAVLPGDFKIKKAKLRGQPSFGMLCSFSELGMGEDHSGILELPQDAPVGQDIREYLQLDDHTIEIDLTPNRADCLGLKGVARELGVLNQLDVCEPVIESTSPTIDSVRGINLDAPDACPRYLGRVIEGVNVNAQSPLWLKEKLRRSGVRSIDPVVDVTNFVLLEMGHPMHAFDNDTLNGDITVRFAKSGEQITLLDGNDITINTDTLVIADEKNALALAGIFGGLHSGVTPDSKNIFLEAAFFNPDDILGKSRQYALHTDASHRYERGVDPALQHAAMERATALLLDIVGGKAGPVVEAVSQEHLPVRNKITLRHPRITRVLGKEIDSVRVSDMLTRLGMQVDATQTTYTVEAPSYRFDIAIEEDLIEEVARIYGYNNIENKAPLAHLQINAHPESEVSTRQLKTVLMEQGYLEAITYSFVDPKKQTLLFPNLEGLALPHPISSDMSVMRVSLLPGLLSALSYNQKRQQSNIKLFESGLIFTPSQQEKTGVLQVPMIGGVLCGNSHDEHWGIANRPLDFFDAKAMCEQLIAINGQSDMFEFVPFNELDDDATFAQDAYHPGQSAAILSNGSVIGSIGAIHPKHQKALGLSGKVFGFEVQITALNARILPLAGVISKYPINRRDVAISVKESVQTGKLLKSIEKIGISELVDLNLFDIYQGQGIEPGYKSLAISVWLQSTEKTLEDVEIQKSVDTVITHLQDQFGATLRD